MAEPVREIVFHHHAAAEYEAARLWYESRMSSDVAADFVANVGRCLELIQSDPIGWGVYQEPFRWLRVNQFPYLLICDAIDERTVLIAAVVLA